MRTENGFKVPPYQFLSNMHLCRVHMYGVWYNSVENAYQASKCADPADRVQFQNLNPYAAKKLGKSVNIRPDFNGLRLVFMEELLRRKFSDLNPVLKQKLIDTGDIELVEVNNWNDFFYGECRGIGDNHLGKLLMKIRQELRDSTKQP